MRSKAAWRRDGRDAGRRAAVSGRPEFRRPEFRRPEFRRPEFRHVEPERRPFEIDIAERPKPYGTMVRKRRMAACLVPALLAGLAPAVAQDGPLSGATLRVAIEDQPFRQIRPTTPDLIEFFYGSDGKVVITVNGSATSGEWTIEGDQYCDRWPPTTTDWYCYDVVREGAELRFISPYGATYVKVAAGD